jgi:hypothetical protein
MPDDDHLQVSIFQPQVSADQRRLAVRYDALRGALGKFGRPFRGSSALILPAPLLLLDRDQMWESQRGDYRSRRALLVFAKDIAGAHSVTLWDAQGRPVGNAYDFPATRPIPVEDPGDRGSVEVRDRHGVTFMVGVPVRMSGMAAGAGPHLEAYEEVLVEVYGEARAEAREDSGTEAPKE